MPPDKNFQEARDSVHTERTYYLAALITQLMLQENQLLEKFKKFLTKKDENFSSFTAEEKTGIEQLLQNSKEIDTIKQRLNINNTQTLTEALTIIAKSKILDLFETSLSEQKEKKYAANFTFTDSDKNILAMLNQKLCKIAEEECGYDLNSEKFLKLPEPEKNSIIRKFYLSYTSHISAEVKKMEMGETSAEKLISDLEKIGLAISILSISDENIAIRLLMRNFEKFDKILPANLLKILNSIEEPGRKPGGP